MKYRTKQLTRIQRNLIMIYPKAEKSNKKHSRFSGVFTILASDHRGGIFQLQLQLVGNQGDEL